MKEAVCRYCGKKIRYVGKATDTLEWYYDREDDEPNGYLCTSRGGSDEDNSGRDKRV